MLLVALLACGGPRLDASPVGAGADDDAPVEYDYYLDADGDGFGAGAIAERSPAPLDVPGLSAVGGDCDDDDAATYPGAIETCDGEDDDCDGAVDLPAPPDAPDGWEDHDGDGHGAGTPRPACDSEGLVRDGLDCDDADPTVFVGAIEVDGDGKDEDCDGGDGAATRVQASVVVRLPGLATDSAGTYAATTGDVTGDGVIDLVAVAAVNEAPSVVVVAGPLVGAMYPQPVALLSASSAVDASATPLAVGDFTGDATDDVTVGWSLYPGPAKTGHDLPMLWGIVGLAAGDVTGDGHADLLITDGSASPSLLSGPWQGEDPALTWEASAGVDDVFVADVDGDGEAEPWFAAHDYNSGTQLEEGLPTGKVTRSFRGSLPSTGDADGDGYDDVVATVTVVEYFSYELAVAHGGATGLTSRADAAVALDTSPWRAVTTVGPDVDGDGDPDVVCAIEGDGVRVVHFDFGSASPGSMASMPKLGLPAYDDVHVSRADADGDGVDDVLLSLATASGGLVYVLEGW